MSERDDDRHDPIPVIQLFGHLLVPLQGDITDRQMDRLTDTVLSRIRSTDVDGLVIDASGVWMVDSHLCAALGRLASAARLMGARSVMCGLGPEVVMTLQEMGFDLRNIHTALGIESALAELGVTAVKRCIDGAGLGDAGADGTEAGDDDRGALRGRR